MILSLWCLIPWCGVQTDPADLHPILTQENAGFPQSSSLGSGRDPIGPQISMARRSVDRRVERIGASLQPRGDRESLRVD